MLEAQNIRQVFGENVILNNINFQFKSNTSYAITGASGAGKTSLLNILSSIEEPDAGLIKIDGQKLNKGNARYFRRDIFGYIFQNYGLIDNKTVADNLAIGLYHKTGKPLQQKELMKRVLNKLNLDEIQLNRKIYSLSGGQQQRVAVGRLLLKEPQIIFADEPTGSVDKHDGDIIINQLLTGFGNNKIVIIATHDAQVVQACDYQLQLKDGHIKVISNSIT